MGEIQRSRLDIKPHTTINPSAEDAGESLVSLSPAKASSRILEWPGSASFCRGALNYFACVNNMIYICRAS